MVYLIPLIIVLICIYVYDYLDVIQGKKIIFYGLLVYCILLSGLSYRMGLDIVNYYVDEYMRSPSLDNLTLDYLFHTPRRQPGWQLLMVVIHQFCASFVALKIIVATILNYSIFITIRRYSPYLFTGILMYFLMLYTYFNFEILRESLAISIFLLSLPFLEKKNYIKYYICCSCAFLFHESSTFIFFFPLIRRIEVSKKNVYIYVCIASFIMFFSSLFMWIPNVIASIGIFSEKAYQYMESDYFGYTKEFTIRKIPSYLLSFFLPIVSTYYMKKENKTHGLEHYIIVYVFIQIILAFFPILMRLGNYLSLFYFIYYILLIRFIVEKTIGKSKIVYTIVCSIYILYTFIPKELIPTERFLNYPHIMLYYPYTSIFDKETIPERELFYSLFFDHQV